MVNLTNLLNSHSLDDFIGQTHIIGKNKPLYKLIEKKECVSEEDYATYMLEYFDIVRQTKKVEKVFWHQLISAGYGLVDNRDGKLRKTKAFYEFKNMIENSKNEK